MSWEMLFSDGVSAWLDEIDQDTYEQVIAAVMVLKDEGPQLGRPLVDSVKASEFKNMKELRPGSGRRSEVRILFAFDPKRRAILLVAGDKSGDWKGWYRKSIPAADDLFKNHLKGMKS